MDAMVSADTYTKTAANNSFNRSANSAAFIRQLEDLFG